MGGGGRACSGVNVKWGVTVGGGTMLAVYLMVPHSGWSCVLKSDAIFPKV